MFTLIALMTLVVNPAMCNHHAVVVADLLKVFHEVPVGSSIDLETKTLIQLFVSPDGKTWSIVNTAPTGLSCIIASGIGWESKDIKPDTPA